jgi:simple sugar transport system permease protein
MSLDLITSLLQSAVTMGVPLLFAALGELIVERAGIVNIGLEGMILSGAFAALVTLALVPVSPWIGLLAAWVAAVSLALLLAFLVVRLKANQVVAGTALNLLAVGLTGVAYRAIFGVTGKAITVTGFTAVDIPLLHNLPVLGAVLFSEPALAYVAMLLPMVIHYFLHHTLPGLRLRMVGENPRAAAAQGVAVAHVQTLALVACGVLAGTSGAFLSIAYAGTFVEGMSAGRGFIALAIVIFGRWSAAGVVGAAFLFGLATALQFHVQALALPIPYQLLLMLPYILTLLVLASTAAQSRAPAALGTTVGE